jgi:uncharacterized protein YbcI
MANMRGPDAGLAQGQLNAAIANEIGKLVADFTGRGAPQSRALVDQNVVVCPLENGATRAEVNLVEAGKAELVRLGRDAMQHAMEPQLVAAVERLTGRKVRTFLSGISASAEASVEVFVVEPQSAEAENPHA